MSEFTLPLDIESLEIIGQQTDKQGNIMLDVRSKKMEADCHKCGKPATKRYGYGPEIMIRHLSISELDQFAINVKIVMTIQLQRSNMIGVIGMQKSLMVLRII